MAVAIAKPSHIAASRCDYTSANRRYRIRKLTFSGNYATDGETITAASVGLRKIEEGHLHGHVAAGSTPTTGVVLGIVPAADGQSVAVRAYELGGTGAAGDPLAEKNNAEAYIAGTNINATFVGY